MIRLVPIALAMQGCIIYERDHFGRCEGCEDTGDTAFDTLTPPATDLPTEPPPPPGGTTAPEAAEHAFSLDPAAGLAGTTVLVVLHHAGDPLTADDVLSVTPVGDLTVASRLDVAGEIVLALNLGATHGPVPMLVELADGTSWLTDEPFVVLDNPGGTTNPCP